MDSIKKVEEKWMANVNRARVEHQSACLEKACNSKGYTNLNFYHILMQQFQILLSLLLASVIIDYCILCGKSLVKAYVEYKKCN